MDKVFVIGRDALPSTLVLGKGENLRWTLLYGVSDVEKVTYPIDMKSEIVIDGPDCDVDIAGAFRLDGSDKINLNIVVRHLSGGSCSRQLYKAVVDGNARYAFDGLIYVASDAQKTKASQQSRNLLVSPDALVDTRPQLEIYADDVECSHGSATGALNEEQLFYMRSRGIPEKEARRILTDSFLNDILARIGK